MILKCFPARPYAWPSSRCFVSSRLREQPVRNKPSLPPKSATTSATTPTVYIGENNQAAGVVSFTESAAGFFTDGVGTGTNTFMICPSGVGYAFTLAPVAMVKNGVAAGNLILRDGTAASTTNIVVGTLLTGVNAGCYGWTIWTASTAPSTIVIGAAPSAATGALININGDQPIGGVNVALSVGARCSTSRA